LGLRAAQRARPFPIRNRGRTSPEQVTIDGVSLPG
jgi:hypothetical protein